MKLNTILKPHRQDGGFTLVEMLIVVAIVGILVAFAVPAMNTAKVDAQATKREMISTSVSTAKVRYLLANTDPNAYLATPVFVDIQPYLLVNGHVPTNAYEFTDRTLSGAGQNIISWGAYPDPTNPTNSAGSGVQWSSTDPPLAL